MLKKRSFVIGMVAVLFTLHLVGCKSQAPAMTTVVLEPTDAPAPTRVSTSTPGTVATDVSEPVPQLEFVWEIKGDPNPFSTPVGVAVDADGNVYVMDTENHRVQKFDRDGGFLTMWGSQGSGEGQFSNASSYGWLGRMAVDTQGNLYAIDVNNYRVQKFDSSGKYQTQWGIEGSGEGEFSFIPFDIAIDAENNVYICESASAHRVQKFDANGKFLIAWGQIGFKDGEFSGDNCAVAVDLDGNILVADNSGSIQKFDAKGQFLSRISLPTINNAMVSLWAMSVDDEGNIYVGDANHSQIIKLDSEGQVLATWNGKDAGDTSFTGLQDIAVDDQGNIYISDALTNTVKKLRQRGLDS